MAKKITFEIKENIGVIYSTIRGRKDGDVWQREVNVVSWNGGVPKIDIRDWDEDHERMSKGITLTESEAEELVELLQNYLTERGR